MPPKHNRLAFSEAAIATPAAGADIVRLADYQKSAHDMAAEKRADELGFSGKHRAQFIVQSVMLAKALEQAIRPVWQPVQPAPAGWQMMQQQQQAGGQIFKGPSQK